MRLADQALGALHELLRGFQAANAATEGRLLGDVLREDPSHVYGGLLATVLRLVFVLHADDRSLLAMAPRASTHPAAAKDAAEPPRASSDPARGKGFAIEPQAISDAAGESDGAETSSAVPSPAAPTHGAAEKGVVKPPRASREPACGGGFAKGAGWARHGLVTELFEQLRDEAARFSDEMDRRYGAWERLLSLFRLVHDGGAHGALRFPARHGRLFDPDAYPFLEGRPFGSARAAGERVEAPKVPNGVVLRVLESLLLLDGKRLSYADLDVEQLGNVYEALMGFTVETVAEPSIALKPQHVTMGLASLLARPGAERLKHLAKEAGCKPSGKAAEAIAQATTLDELKAALAGSLSPRTPDILPPGTLILQPTEERRRSGSHYTPRALAERVVDGTLRPLVEALGPAPTPAQLLDLAICDPAMGSGAFLVAACRWLGDELVAAWRRRAAEAANDSEPGHARDGGAPESERNDGGAGGDSGPGHLREVDARGSERSDAARNQALDDAGAAGEPGRTGGAYRTELGAETLLSLPPVESSVLHARRLVAQRCLYGVDSDPFAVELAKLSLWLVTRAKDHPFTFVDHALRRGDSLAGLSCEQIASFHWPESAPRPLVRDLLESAVEAARARRAQIRALAGSADRPEKRRLLREADEALRAARTMGHLVLEAFLTGESAKERGAALARFGDHVERRGSEKDLPETPEANRLHPFHWEIELPEVFRPDPAGGADRPKGGFSAFLGNPPWVSFAGRAAQPLAEPLRRCFAELYESFAGYRNLQGVFVERCARMLRPGGRLGFVLPSSMSEQDGYAPTRLAHDRLCACDPDLPDLGEDAFLGVFQPSMVLRSTRLSEPRRLGRAMPWPVERPDLDDGARRLIAKMTRFPPLPPHLFGERGLQSSGDDTAHLADREDAAHDVPLRVGGDIEPFRRKAPSTYADPAWFGDRLRPAEEWRAVRVLIRQTARVPMAALSDGVAFRNSVLAGFDDDTHPAAFLVAYLNATPIRWLHYVRHRDARQGMPQMKIGHLRATPSPPDRALVADLAAMGEAWSARNEGIDDAEQARLDARVAAAFDLTEEEQARVRRWWASLR